MYRLPFCLNIEIAAKYIYPWNISCILRTKRKLAVYLDMANMHRHKKMKISIGIFSNL